MSSIEIISLLVTIVCLLSFSVVFTFLFRHYFLSQIENIKLGLEDLNLFDNVVDEARKEKSKASKALKWIRRIISYIVLAFLVFFFGFSLFERFSSGTVMIGGQSLIVIASGSMSQRNKVNTYLDENDLNNQFDTYDVIQIGKVESAYDLNLYDVVAYKNDTNTIIVHRIIQITEENGNRKFITRGDSNSASDNGSQYEDYLSFDRIVGRYTGFRIPGVGAFVIFLQSGSGIITVFAIIYCYVMFEFYSSKYNKAIRERTDLLLSLVPFDTDADNVDDMELIPKEELIFKGVCYKFTEYEFTSKEDYVPPEEDEDEKKEDEESPEEKETSDLLKGDEEDTTPEEKKESL